MNFHRSSRCRKQCELRRCGRGKKFQQWFDCMGLAAERNGSRRSSVARALRFVATFAKVVWCRIASQSVQQHLRLDDWLRERFFRHEGNADVIRQELASEHGIVIWLRSVELRVKCWRRELKAQKRATVRFETAPGHQMQIDFGDTKVWIGGERVRIHVFVATLGYSCRMHFRASQRQRQADWFEGMEGAFLRFGGVPAAGRTPP